MPNYRFVDQDTGQALETPKQTLPLGLGEAPQVEVHQNHVEFNHRPAAAIPADPVLPAPHPVEVKGLPQKAGGKGVATVHWKPGILGAADPVIPPAPIATARQQQIADMQVAQQQAAQQVVETRQRGPTQPAPHPAADDSPLEAALDNIAEARERIKQTMPVGGILPKRPRLGKKLRDRLGRK